MHAPIRLAFASRIPRAPEEVWRHATDMAGVNRELAPLLRMTYPPDCADLEAVVRARAAEVPAGSPLVLFRSTLLLGGLVPVDRVQLTLVEVEPGRFLERSPMRSMALWQHERTVRAAPDGCELIDRLTFLPRFPAVRSLLRNVVLMSFRHRHARLARLFGAYRVELPRLIG